MVFTVDGITSESTELLPNANRSIVSSPSFKVTSLSDSQPLNAERSIFITDDGISTLSREVQFLNVAYSILDRDPDSFTLFRFT